jgi:tRNA(Ile)-lysidine synthase
MVSRQSGFIQKIKNALRDMGISRGSRICIGVSGGPDSTALLHALAHISAEMEIVLFAAYLDHGLRAALEIADEIVFLEDTASRLQIELFIGRIPHGEILKMAKKEKKSIEEYARERRYEYYHGLLRSIPAGYIATGHTLDDTIETVIMRFFQGSDMTGLSGIPLMRNSIIRPLSSCKKEEVFDYLRSIGSDYKVDSSNQESQYLRNKTRNNLLPVIREIFPGFEKNIGSSVQKSQVLKDYIESEGEKTPVWEPSGKGYKIGYQDFISIHPYMRLFSFFQMYDTLIRENRLEKLGRLPFRFLQPILKLTNSEKSGLLFRGHGIECKQKGDYLFCNTDIVANEKKGYLITIEKRKKIELHCIGKSLELIAGNEKKKKLCNALSFNGDSIRHPIVVRSKRPGDFIYLKGEKRIVKKVYNEWKVPERERWKIPIVEDRNGILAIFGLTFGYSNMHVDYFYKTDKGLSENNNMQQIIIND